MRKTGGVGHAGTAGHEDARRCWWPRGAAKALLPQACHLLRQLTPADSAWRMSLVRIPWPKAGRCNRHCPAFVSKTENMPVLLTFSCAPLSKTWPRLSCRHATGTGSAGQAQQRVRRRFRVSTFTPGISIGELVSCSMVFSGPEYRSDGGVFTELERLGVLTISEGTGLGVIDFSAGGRRLVLSVDMRKAKRGGFVFAKSFLEMAGLVG